MTIARRVALVIILLSPSHAFAASFGHPVCTTSTADVVSQGERVWRVEFAGGAPPAAVSRLALGVPAALSSSDAQGSPRAKAFEYSHGYEVRRKIHVYASVATLPLFATQVILGQKLYDQNGGSGVKTAHSVVAGSIAGLFGVNSVTGVWNLWESRKDPSHRGKRMAHGIMMLAADAGFVATGLLAPDSDDFNSFEDRRGTHRTVALTSMGIATASYLMMLFSK
jgi:hypothetical protein